MDDALGRIERRGQVTIFIILGILIVAGVVAFAFFMRGGSVGPTTDVNPVSLVQSCVEDLVEDSVDLMLANGGQVSPSQAILYQSDEWNYLCYQADFYQGCYNLHPMLQAQIEKEIKKNTLDGIENCFNIMRQDFEDQGFVVDAGDIDYSVDLMPGYVDVKLEKRIDVSDDGVSKVFDDFGFEVLSPIYELVHVARDIVNDESQFCNFEYNGYMLLYSNFDIRRIDYRDSKLYRVTDRRTGDEFRFAVRSCAFAPGV